MSWSAKNAKSMLVVCVAAALFPFGAHFQMAGVYAAVADYGAGLREASTGLRVILFLLLVLVASWRPRILDQRTLGVASIGCALTSFVALELAIPSVNVGFSAVGLACSGVATVWAGAQLALAFIRLDSLREAVVAVSVGSLAGRAAAGVIPAFDPHVAVALCPIIQVVIIALLYKGNSGTLTAIAHQDAPVDVELANPASFLPPVSGLFLCALLFHIASGYGLALGEGIALEGPQVFPVFVLAGITVWLLFGRADEKADSLFSISFLLVTAGYLSAPFAVLVGANTAHALINAGTFCFDVLAWIAVIAIGRRNVLALLPTFGLLRCMMSLGTLLGATIGHMSSSLVGTSPMLMQAIAAGMLFLFVAVTWVWLRDFSFSQTIRGIELLPEGGRLQVAPSGDFADGAAGAVVCRGLAGNPEMPEGRDGVAADTRDESLSKDSVIPDERESRFDARCAELACAAGLAERESEILAFLARGRNGRYLMDHYVVSRNTVKSHIKHIYAKLGVHSQQELIDRVEHGE